MNATSRLQKLLGGFVLVPLLASIPASAADECKNHYILTSPFACKWTRTGDLNSARFGHTADLLPDGSVLVVGGTFTYERGADGRFGPAGGEKVERYDPGSRAWRYAAPLHRARSWHASVGLLDGRVLVVGGELAATPALPPGTAEIYDPAANTWTPTAIMNHLYFRWRPVATLLADGRVLVTGGASADGAFGPPEIYDPRADRWDPVGGPLDVHRYGHVATHLPDGSVMYTGGTADTWLEEALAVTEQFDAVTMRFGSAPTALFRREHHTATVLPDGNIMVAGGADSHFIGGVGMRQYTTLAATEVYDAAAAKWVRGHDMRHPRQSHTTTLLPSGALLIAGGLAYSGEVPRLTWEPMALAELRVTPYAEPFHTEPMHEFRWMHTATLLRDGTVLVVGGRGIDDKSLASAELFGAPAAARTR